MAAYLANDDYQRLVAALLNVQPDPLTGEVGEDQVKLALGEHDIWPESIHADAELTPLVTLKNVASWRQDGEIVVNVDIDVDARGRAADPAK